MEQLIQTRLTRSPTTSHPHGQSALLFLSLSTLIFITKKIKKNKWEFFGTPPKILGRQKKGK